MLQSAIHGDNVFAVGIIKSGRKRRGLPKIAPQTNYRDPAVDTCNLSEQVNSIVGGAIIDKNNFETLSANFHDGLQPIVKVGDVFLLIVQGDDNGVLQHESPRLYGSDI